MATKREPIPTRTIISPPLHQAPGRGGKVRPSVRPASTGK